MRINFFLLQRVYIGDESLHWVCVGKSSLNSGTTRSNHTFDEYGRINYGIKLSSSAWLNLESLVEVLARWASKDKLLNKNVYELHSSTFISWIIRELQFCKVDTRFVLSLRKLSAKFMRFLQFTFQQVIQSSKYHTSTNSTYLLGTKKKSWNYFHWKEPTIPNCRQYFLDGHAWNLKVMFTKLWRTAFIRRIVWVANTFYFSIDVSVGKATSSIF